MISYYTLTWTSFLRRPLKIVVVLTPYVKQEPQLRNIVVKWKESPEWMHMIWNMTRRFAHIKRRPPGRARSKMYIKHEVVRVYGAIMLISSAQLKTQLLQSTDLQDLPTRSTYYYHTTLNKIKRSGIKIKIIKLK